MVEEATLAEQTLALAADLPERPLVLGGCCCSHVGAVEGLAARARAARGRLDRRPRRPEHARSSPSGNQWGMPLRMLIDGGAVRPEDVALVGARNLDPPEEEFIERAASTRATTRVERALAGADAVYVALDCDVARAGRGSTVFMPEPDGLRLDELEQLLRDIAGARRASPARA